MRSITRPMTTFFSWNAFSTSSQIFIFSAFSRERTTYPSRSSVRSSRTSTMSPGWAIDLPGLVDELIDGNNAFGLVADVDDDLGLRHLDDRALDDIAFREIPEAGIVQFEQAGVFLRIGFTVLG